VPCLLFESGKTWVISGVFPVVLHTHPQAFCDSIIVLKFTAWHRRWENTNVAFGQRKGSQLPPASREKFTRMLNPSRKTKTL